MEKCILLKAGGKSLDIVFTDQVEILKYDQIERFVLLIGIFLFVSQESNIDFDEMQEAIMLIRVSKLNILSFTSVIYHSWSSVSLKCSLRITDSLSSSCRTKTTNYKSVFWDICNGLFCHKSHSYVNFFSCFSLCHFCDFLNLFL